MSRSLCFMQGISKSDIKCLVCGFTRYLTSANTPAPSDIIRTILLFFNPIITWTLPIREVIHNLNNDYTTICGPEINLNGYKFVLKLKRSRNNLYFGAWYQSNDIIQHALHSYFQSSYNTQIANKIVESFNFIIIDEEFDEVSLILHDMTDPTYSCILEHIESELRTSSLLISYGSITTAINNIKQNMIRILSLYNPRCAISFTFRARFYCHETQTEHKKLCKFATNQVCETGADLYYWRNKYNNFKDCRLGFDEIIKDKENLNFDCYMELIDDIPDQDDMKERDLHYECMIEEQLKDKLLNMKHGDHDHVYLPGHFGGNYRFAVFVGHDNEEYNIFIQQLYPSKVDRKYKVMDVIIGSNRLDIHNIEYERIGSIRFTEEDDIELVAKFGSDAFVTNEDLCYKPISFRIHLRDIE